MLSCSNDLMAELFRRKGLCLTSGISLGALLETACVVLDETSGEGVREKKIPCG